MQHCMRFRQQPTVVLVAAAVSKSLLRVELAGARVYVHDTLRAAASDAYVSVSAPETGVICCSSTLHDAASEMPCHQVR